jgi:hypothetical protein
MEKYIFWYQKFIRLKIVIYNYNIGGFLMAKKRPLHIWLSPEIDDKLRELIFKKYSKYEKGLLSHEVEEALKNWLLLHTQTQNLKLGVSNTIKP